MTSLSVVWVCLVLATSPLLLVTEASCPFEGREICEGAVTKELSTLVKICVDGKLKLKKKADIAPGWPKAGGGTFYTCNISCIPCSPLQSVSGMARSSVTGPWSRISTGGGSSESVARAGCW